IKMDDGKMFAPRCSEPVPKMLWIACRRLIDRICSNELFGPMLKQTNIQRKTIVKQSKSSAKNRAVLFPRLHLEANARRHPHDAGERISLNSRAQVQSKVRRCQPMILSVSSKLRSLFFNRRRLAELDTPYQFVVLISNCNGMICHAH